VTGWDNIRFLTGSEPIILSDWYVNTGAAIFPLNGESAIVGGAYSDGSTWNPASSIRWKENITPLTDGVESLNQLHPVAYNYKKTPGKRTMGFIAEEIGKVLPTVVDWDAKEVGFAEGYDHLAILALAVEAVKEQQREIEQLRTENKSLQERIEALERKLATEWHKLGGGSLHAPYVHRW